MIVNIRGTHGSGKSTLAAQLMAKAKSCGELEKNTKGRPFAYELSLEGLRKLLYLIGPYETACGGCDAIQPYDRIWPLVLKYAKKGHVLFEGALVSSSVGEIGRAMAARKDCVVCLLDTPVEVCLARIQSRREARGDTRPLNPKNTVAKHEAVARSIPKLKALGLRCVTLNYKKANKQLMEVLLENK